MGSRVYQALFWRDFVWVWLILLLLLGLPFLFVSLAAFFYSLIVLNGAEKALAIFPLMFAVVGWVLLFAFECVRKQQVIFTDNAIIYKYPKYWLIGFTEKKLQFEDIGTISLGVVALSKLYPEVLKQRERTLIPKDLGIELRSSSLGGQKLGLPVFRDKEYFNEFKKLIEQLDLQQTFLPFVFKRRA